MARRSGMSSEPTRAGFTLVELAVVVALLAVVAAIAAPRFASASARARLDAASSRVVNDISITAASARAASASRQMVFNTLEDQYVMMGVPSRGAFVNRSVRLSGQPYETNLVSASFDGSPLLSMNGYGLAEFSGAINLAVGKLGRRIVLLKGGSSVQVEALELNADASGDVMPGIRRVTSQVTLDAAASAVTFKRAN